MYMFQSLKKLIKNLFKKTTKREIVLFHHVESNPLIQKSSCCLSTSDFCDFLANNKFVNIEEIFISKDSKAITFDDGLEDVYKIAYPLLLKRNIPFVIFLNPNTIGQAGYLNKEQISKMLDSKLCTIGSHGLDHIDLTKINNEEVIYQLKKSKDILETEFNTKINYYAYPHGAYSKKIIKILKKEKIFSKYFTVSDRPLFSKGNKYKIPRRNISD